MEHSLSVSLSLSAGPPESLVLRGEALTQGGQDISGFSAPGGGGIMSKKKKGKKSVTNRETSGETL